MSADCEPTAEEMAAANADIQKRARKFIERIRLATPSPYQGVFSNDEEECPATVDAFDKSEAGNAVLDALFMDRADA